MVSLAVLQATPVDLLSSETLNVVGPIGTVLAVAAGLYWALLKGKLVVGSQVTRERAEHDATIRQMREDHALQIRSVREDAVASATRRELENAATIMGLRADVGRMYGAWQITDEARERVTRARDGATSQALLSLLEAVRAGPLGDRLPPLEIAEGAPTVGSDDG